MSQSSREVRIGIVTSGDKIPAWQVYAIEKLAQLSFVRIVVAYALEQNEKVLEQYPKFEKLHWLLRRLVRIDASLFRRSGRFHNDALELVDLRSVRSIPVFRPVSHAGSAGAKTLHDDERAELKSADLDVLIDLGAWLSDDLAGIARLGIWRHVHHPTIAAEEALPGFWECLDGQPVTGSRLDIVSNRHPQTITAYVAYSTTYELSPLVNRSYSCWTAVPFFARELESLCRLGEEAFINKVLTRKFERVAGAESNNRKGAFFTSVQCYFKYASRILLRLVRERLYFDQWYLLYSNDEASDLDLTKYSELVPPSDEFWADPHVVRKDGTNYVFIEVYTEASKKGHISVVEIDDSGLASEPEKILETDYHLSYPLVLEYNNDFFLLPETKGNRTIEIYKCAEFPHNWEFNMILMDSVDATDATPLWHNGKWWLFVTLSQAPGARCREELYLYYSDKLLTTNWVPHPLNPIVSDVRSARPAGRIFKHGERLVRPSQDSSYRYGYGLVFNDIVELSESTYREVRTSTLLPTWEGGVKGIHTYSRDGNFTVVDALRPVRRNRAA